MKDQLRPPMSAHLNTIAERVADGRITVLIRPASTSVAITSLRLRRSSHCVRRMRSVLVSPCAPAERMMSRTRL